MPCEKCNEGFGGRILSSRILEAFRIVCMLVGAYMRCMHVSVYVCGACVRERDNDAWYHRHPPCAFIPLFQLL